MDIIALNVPVITEFFSITYFGNTLLDYTIFFGIILGGFIGAKIIYWCIQKYVKKITSKTKFRLDDLLIDMLEEPVFVYIVLIAINIGWQFLDFPLDTGTYRDKIPIVFGHIMYIAIVFTSAWLLARIIDAVIESYLKPLTSKSKSDLDDHLIPIFSRIVNIIIYVMAFIMVMEHFEQPIGPLIAGLGIGGLAIAFAAKDILANLFGSLTIIFDKPFKIGDRIKTNNYDGTVQEISLRTTRIETLEGRMVYIPNMKFTDGIVENVSVEWARKVSFVIGLVYGTDAKGMQNGVDTVKKILKRQKGVDDDNMFVFFGSFGDFSKNIRVIYWITDQGYDNISRIMQEVNMAIETEFAKAGLEFAFPTQTIELKK